MKKILIKKYDTDEDISTTSYDSETYETSKEDGINYYTSIVNSNYIKKGKSLQDTLTLPEVKQRLDGYVMIENQNILKTLTPFKTWIKYLNKKTKKFRVGGLLSTIDPDLKYIMLVNTNLKLTWSVQLKDNILFIPDPNRINEKIKEQKIKDKLYQLYKEKKLTTI